MEYEVVIVGGSFAGLAAALYLARARKKVCVLDGGRPRNRFAAASHGFFAQDGRKPHDLLAAMRGQVAAYPNVDIVSNTAVSAAPEHRRFLVGLSGGSAVAGARLLLAFGVSDILPEFPGLRERWGKSVLHCPYCHGYEESGRRLGVLNLSPASVQQALLVSDWGPTTFFANGATMDEASLEQLQCLGVDIDPDPVAALIGGAETLSAVQFGSGRIRELDALFIAPPNRLNGDLAAQLGCDASSTALGQAITVDETKQTTVAGVFAAGDITRAMHNITFACADGVTAAMAIHRSLLQC